MIHDASLDELCQKVWDGGRIDQAEALRLYALPLEELGALADRRRQLHRAAAHGGHGADTVTYIVDRNVNYTNVCNVYCKFCAFWRAEKDTDSYVITHEEMDRKIEETIALGGNQILMQGGHHPKLTKQWYLDLLAHIRAKFPGFNVHGFSPSEMVAFAEFFHEPVEQILKDFVAAGLGSVPGGGGEILVDRVRNRIAPLKASASEWMGVMDTAHRLGLASSITMMFGHVETVAERIEHLEVVRAQQDRSLARLPSLAPIGGEGQGEGASCGGGAISNCQLKTENLPLPSSPSPHPSPPVGAREKMPSPIALSSAYAHALETGALNGGAFTAFICWTFQPENAVLKAPTVGAHEYLRTQALSRIYLDNLPSVQSSWVTQGQEIGQLALRYGANDLGSIMIEENVVSAAGTTFRMSVADMQRLITDLGFAPRQRDNWYRLC